ncbi:hypothetical protein H0I69_15485 [Yersinia enterocolitica]|uniref:hypothetical protein n=1 Tax=Yersinia enterocolitica TaxID=630 RepID=UPI001CA526A4|nr:hypothetical protein [Yersinia enterocolitica]MBW5869196.1 hypothetical protein [Yersinia enterocolitica]
MSNDLFTIKLSPSISRELLDNIKLVIPETEMRVSRKIRTCDAVGAGSTLLSLTIEIVNSKAFCAAVAVVLCKWISSRSNKKVKIKKGDRIEEYSNLNAKELAEIIERNQGLDLTVNQDDN